MSHSHILISYSHCAKSSLQASYPGEEGLWSSPPLQRELSPRVRLLPKISDRCVPPRGLKPWPYLKVRQTKIYTPFKAQTRKKTPYARSWTKDTNLKMKKWSARWTQFMQLRKEAWKKNSGLQRGLNPWPRDYRCDALPTELWSHWR